MAVRLMRVFQCVSISMYVDISSRSLIVSSLVGRRPGTESPLPDPRKGRKSSAIRAGFMEPEDRNLEIVNWLARRLATNRASMARACVIRFFASLAGSENLAGWATGSNVCRREAKHDGPETGD